MCGKRKKAEEHEPLRPLTMDMPETFEAAMLELRKPFPPFPEIYGSDPLRSSIDRIRVWMNEAGRRMSLALLLIEKAGQWR